MENYTLNILIALLMSVVIIKILMNLLNYVGIDFVGFFEELWEKIKIHK